VISGLDTTATVTVPELLVLLLALPLEPPLLEQAASATKAATEPTAASVRSLNGRELMKSNLHNGEDLLAGGTGDERGAGWCRRDRAYARLSGSRSYEP
jgi:hypothetical protein